jgi:heme O synthase-like polyprenyltransferase
MKIWHKPIIYILSHIFIGYIAFFHTELLVAILGYQVVQLLLNIRFFIFSWKIETGNSIEHTALKLLEYSLGYFIAFMQYKALNKA